ncbi:MAG: type II toxin-antitoxin system VapC family toxin [Proteobacteria bacterium]|nr:type II toxin-antitoxin system VapC family toxin [Pseudomonadota bacterium]
MGLIYVDSCLVIYLAEDRSRQERIARAMEAEATFALSPLVKLECLVSPLKLGDLALERFYLDLFARFITLEMSETVYLQSARLRAQFGLRTPDALHLACALHHRCESLWTNDNRLERASLGLARNVLKS